MIGNSVSFLPSFVTFTLIAICFGYITFCPPSFALDNQNLQSASNEPTSDTNNTLISQSVLVNDAESNGRAVLGIGAVNITSAVEDHLGLENTSGVLITDVHPFSDAAAVGIKAGDNLTEINGKDALLGGDILLSINNVPVNSTDDITSVLKKYSPGDLVYVTLLRNGDVQERTLSLISENNLVPLVHRLAGKYMIPSSGFQVNIPQGWSGLRMISSAQEYSVVAPNILNFTDLESADVSISFMKYDLPNQNTSLNINSTFSSVPPFANTSQGAIPECTLLSESYHKLNQTLSLDIIGKCNEAGQSTKVRHLILSSEKAIFVISLQANSSQLYEANLDVFNNVLNSIKIDNPVNITGVLGNRT